MFKNVATKIALFAFDTTTGAAKTGDAANLTAYVSKDYGAVTVLTDTTATEMDATNAKGWYLFDVAQTEANADALLFTAKSSTANISVVGQYVHTTPNRFTTLVIDAAGLADANTVKIGPTGSGTAQTARDIGASVLLSSGTGTGQLSITSGIAKVDVDTIKTNPVVNAGTVTFPTGATLASTTNITAGTVTTATNVTTVNGLAANVITAAATAADFGAEVATAVWQDATAGDFTVASSIGKALYTGNIVPGAAGGLFIAGSNAATTVNFTGSLSGSVGSVTGAVGSVTGNVGGNVTGSVGSVAAGGITASSIAADAIGASELAADAVAEIADAVWDEVLSGHLTAGTTGNALNAAGSAGDPWSTSLPGAYGAGTAGKIIGDNITGNAYTRLGAPAGASVSADVAAVKTDTGNLVTRITSTLFTGITSLAEWLGLMAGKQTGNTTARTEMRATGAGSGTYSETTDSLEAVRDRGDAAWITATGFSTLDAAGVRSAVGLASANLDTQLTAIDDYLDTEVAAIKAKTDSLTFTVAGQIDANVIDWKGTAAPAMTGDAFARLGAPAGASVSADIAAAKVDTAAIKVKTDFLPSATAGNAGGVFIAGTNAATTVSITGNITGNLSGSVGSVTTVSDKTGYRLSATGVDDVLDEVVDGTTTARESFRLANATLGGKASGLAGVTAVYRDLADTKNRISATVDADGNRSAVTRDLT